MKRQCKRAAQDDNAGRGVWAVWEWGTKAVHEDSAGGMRKGQCRVRKGGQEEVKRAVG